MISKLLAYAKKNHFSDLHLSAGAVPMMRIHGELVPIPEVPPFDPDELLEMLHEVMNEANRKIYKKTMELDFAVEFSGNRFRGNAFRTIRGPAAVFRDIASEAVDLTKLGVPATIISLAQLRNGLVLVVGPIGSGKSTTIAGLIDIINTNRAAHIITIEDPVEFLHAGKKSMVNQREVGASTLSFTDALRGALREDPDVILVGEMRDTETMRLAITAAETGKLVFGTLHTVSAAQTVNRIIDSFPAGDRAVIRSMLGISLKAVVCQKLVARQQGGRCAVYEIMLAIPAIKNLIREEKIHQIPSMIELGRKIGMITMKDYLAQLVADKVISDETAKYAMVDLSAVD